MLRHLILAFDFGHLQNSSKAVNINAPWRRASYWTLFVKGNGGTLHPPTHGFPGFQALQAGGGLDQSAVQAGPWATPGVSGSPKCFSSRKVLHFRQAAAQWLWECPWQSGCLGAGTFRDSAGMFKKNDFKHAAKGLSFIMASIEHAGDIGFYLIFMMTGCGRSEIELKLALEKGWGK